MKSVTTIENAAPCANEIASCVYFEISPAPRLSAQSVACFWIWMRSRPCVSSQCWSRSMSCSAPVLPAVVGHGDVVVDPVRRRAGLVDDDAPERERDERDRGREEEEDERHREARAVAAAAAGRARAG